MVILAESGKRNIWHSTVEMNEFTTCERRVSARTSSCLVPFVIHRYEKRRKNSVYTVKSYHTKLPFRWAIHYICSTRLDLFERFFDRPVIISNYFFDG